MMISSQKAFSLVEMMTVVALIAIVLAIVLPNYVASTRTSKKIVCISNLKQIDTAIDQWANDYNIALGTVPDAQAEEEIYGYIKGGKPKCPAGGTFTIYRVGDNPQVRCSLESKGHSLTEE